VFSCVCSARRRATRGLYSHRASCSQPSIPRSPCPMVRFTPTRGHRNYSSCSSLTRPHTCLRHTLSPSNGRQSYVCLLFAAHSGHSGERRPAPNRPLYPIRYGHQNKPFVFSYQSKTLRGTGLPFNARRDVNALALGVTSTFPAARTDRPGAQRFNSGHIKSISVQVARRILRIWMKPPNSLLFR
jgi:hypothetical protein